MMHKRKSKMLLSSGCLSVSVNVCWRTGAIRHSYTICVDTNVGPSLGRTYCRVEMSLKASDAQTWHYLLP